MLLKRTISLPATLLCPGGAHPSPGTTCHSGGSTEWELHIERTTHAAAPGGGRDAGGGVAARLVP
jgi:hypothetical protein